MREKICVPLLTIENLSVHLNGRTLIDNISLTVNEGETVGLVGQSGAGKSTLALAINGLLPSQMSATGKSCFRGKKINFHDHNKLRGKIGLIFQDASTSLNPAFSVGVQIADIAAAQSRMAGNGRWMKRGSGAQYWQAAMDLIAQVGLAKTEGLMRLYPHQLSGGMKQRVLIAMALAGQPELLIADEPTTALDTVLQRQILELLRDYQSRSNCGLLLISHDISAIKGMTDRIAVMSGGAIVETASTAAIIGKPGHPYTKKLVASLMSLADAKEARSKRKEKLLSKRTQKV